MLASCTAALLAVAPPGHAQTVVSLGAYGAHAPGHVAARGVAGVSVGMAAGPVGARVSGGVPLAVRAPAGTTPGRDPWSADADLLLFVDVLPGTGGAAPPALFALAGVGAASPLLAASGARPVGNWSYGAGVRLPLWRDLELTGEGRVRRPFAVDSAALFPAAGSEIRLGLAIRLGGRPTRGARRPAGPATREPASTRPAPERPRSYPTATAGGSAARVLPTAERYLGVPYRWGGTSPTTGFDCSGYVQYVFNRHGTRLPRTSRDQAGAGTRLDARWAALRPGDLVMFAEPGARISHVAIYAGSRRIIHATSSGGRVRYDDLDTQRGQWFARRLVAARRVTANGAGLVRSLIATEPSLVPIGELDPPDRAPRP
jgi:cell wall-associated NlpC family hydrolase